MSDSSDDDADRRKLRKQKMEKHLIMQNSDDVINDRDRIAEKAMQSYLLDYAHRDYSKVAKWAYEMADAMIKERNKRRR